MQTLEELFKQDILRFLDEHTSQKTDTKKLVRAEEQAVYTISKDYVKEVREALAKDQIGKAKLLFEELRKKYNELAYHHIDKARIYRILEDVYYQIRNYLMERTKEKDIYEETDYFKTKSGEQTDKLTELMEKVQSLLKEKNTEEAKKIAITLINEYNQLPPKERTQDRYNKIKILLKDFT